MTIQPKQPTRSSTPPPAVSAPQPAAAASAPAAPVRPAAPAADASFTSVEGKTDRSVTADAAVNAAVAARETRRAALRQAKAAPAPAAALAPPFDQASADAKIATIKKLQEGHTDRSEEAKIIGLMHDAKAPELNYMISRLNMADLISDIDDRGIFGPNNRTAFLQMLTRDRLGDLSVSSRASLLDGLQRSDTDDDPEKKAVLNLFLGTHGADLTDLKNRVDAGGDFHDLQQLLDHDLGDSKIRSQILQHIQNESHGQPSAGNKVLSDIDDTFYVNWVDKSYPSKTVYPGVRQFYQELDRGPGATPDRQGDLGFLTARPWDPVGIFENQTHQMLRDHGVPEATVITGDVLHLIGNQNIADKKVENFNEYKQQYPEYGYVFMGDSGQGDVMAAQKMLATDPKALAGAFIHDVVNTPEAKREEYRKQGIVFFDSYVGAAAEAFDKGLIQREGMARIAQSAISEFNQVKFDSDAQRQARLAELQRDVARVNSKLPPEQQVRF
jgi:uncharacterized protein DUF2183